MTATHVFLDFAGTLVEGVPNWESPQIVACAEAGLVVTPSQVKAAIWDVWRPLEGCAHVAASVDEATYQRWIDEIEAEIMARLGIPRTGRGSAVRRVTELQLETTSYRVYPDVGPALRELRRSGVKVGIVSNFAWRLPLLVDQLGLGALVDDVVTSAQVGYRKPRPEIFDYARSRLGASAETCVFCGDDPDCDFVGARRAGVRSILLDRADPDALATDLTGSLELLPLLI
jgi:putative hydrolase of the HAD superfamily